MSVKAKNSVRFVQGNEACAEAAIAAGVRFYAGYPITPSSEIAEILSKRLPQVGGKFIQMEDEIASIGAVLGASLAGVKSITATSGPGFSLMQELIGYASLSEIPSVIVNVQRGGPSTGMPTSPSQADVMQARWGAHGDHPMIVLCPSSVKDMYDITVRAINLSESLRTPVIVLADEVVGHLYEKIEFPDPGKINLLSRPKPDKKDKERYLPYKTTSGCNVPSVADFGEGYRFNVTGLIHGMDGFPVNDPKESYNLLTRLHEKINSRLEDICSVETQYLDDSSLLLCSYGATSRSCAQVIEEVRSDGNKVGEVCLKTLWPFPDFFFDRLNPRVKTVLVCEMNMGQILREVERASRGRFKVLGINSPKSAVITPEEIKDKIMQEL